MPPLPEEGTIIIHVRMSRDEYRELIQRSGVTTGAALATFMLGSALDKPRAELREQVREISAAVLAKFRAEIERDRAQAAARESERPA
jgi:hypothetical protein